MKHLTRSEGMTLVEVLIAMVVLAIAVTALVAGLGSSILAVQRAAKASTAGSIADKQMEAFRSVTYDLIGTTSTSGADAVYTTTGSPYNSPYDATQKIDSLASCSPSTYCTPTQIVSASGGTYRVDTYVDWACPAGGTLSTGTTPPTCSGESVSSVSLKQVTVVVRDNSTPTKVLFKESSNFNPLGG